MKKISMITVALLLVAAAAAQSAHRIALDKLCDALTSSCVTMKCSYLIHISNTIMKGNAEVAVQGDSYTMIGNGLQVYCDGTKVWSVDSAAKEVYVESFDDLATNSLANPAALFMRLGNSFSVGASSQSDGKFLYELSPKVYCGIVSADLVLNPDGKPMSAVFVLEDDIKVEVTVESVAMEKTKPEDVFRPQVAFGSDWIVTEL